MVSPLSYCPAESRSPCPVENRSPFSSSSRTNSTRTFSQGPRSLNQPEGFRFFSSRIWLSIQGGFLGFSVAYIIASIPALPSGLRELGGTLGLDNLLLLLGALSVFWIRLYFRRRGTRAFLDSRTWLSASSFLMFFLVAFLFLHQGFLAAESIFSASLVKTGALSIAVVGLVHLWFSVNLRKRLVQMPVRSDL